MNLIFNMLFLSCAVLAPVPSIAPYNVTAITLTPTSVNVSWDGLSTASNNGIIIVYEVQYNWTMDNEHINMSNNNASGSQTNLILSDLQECVRYSISVRAYTSKGPGPFSKTILDSSPNGWFGQYCSMVVYCALPHRTCHGP